VAKSSSTALIAGLIVVAAIAVSVRSVGKVGPLGLSSKLDVIDASWWGMRPFDEKPHSNLRARHLGRPEFLQ